MSPTETRTISSLEHGTASGPEFDPSRLDLPAVIRAIFDCTRNVTLHQSLESFGACADPLGPVRSIYPTGQGTPVVTVWRDRIEADVDGSLFCRLDPPLADIDGDRATACEARRARGLRAAAQARSDRARPASRRSQRTGHRDVDPRSNSRRQPRAASAEGVDGARMTRAFLLLGSLLVIGTAAGFHFDARPLSDKGASSVKDPHQVGPASWYGPGFHGRQTANGERFDQDAMTMAHRSMKFGTCVRVTRVDTGDSVLVRVNDRGPYVPPRIADLSRGAAAELGMLQRGVADVRLEPMQKADC